MTRLGDFERVYVENEWYDGPRAGVADVGGVPHRFQSQFDYTEDDYLGTYLVWPVDADTLLLEVEQWRIFSEWDAKYLAGSVAVESHPGHGGINARWDEIEEKLKNVRSEVPPHARRVAAEIEHVEGPPRYGPDGPAYRLRWRFL
jgi:hypothetical protein